MQQGVKVHVRPLKKIVITCSSREGPPEQCPRTQTSALHAHLTMECEGSRRDDWLALMDDRLRQVGLERAVLQLFLLGLECTLLCPPAGCVACQFLQRLCLHQENTASRAMTLSCSCKCGSHASGQHSVKKRMAFSVTSRGRSILMWQSDVLLQRHRRSDQFNISNE